MLRTRIFEVRVWVVDASISPLFLEFVHIFHAIYILCVIVVDIAVLGLAEVNSVIFSSKVYVLVVVFFSVKTVRVNV